MVRHSYHHATGMSSAAAGRCVPPPRRSSPNCSRDTCTPQATSRRTSRRKSRTLSSDHTSCVSRAHLGRISAGGSTAGEIWMNSRRLGDAIAPAGARNYWAHDQAARSRRDMPEIRRADLECTSAIISANTSAGGDVCDAQHHARLAPAAPVGRGGRCVAREARGGARSVLGARAVQRRPRHAARYYGR